MGRKDALTYNYMNDNSRFADIMNFFLYAGKQVIRPESLRSLDSRMTVLPFGRNFRSIPVQKYRDLLKYTCARTDEKAAYLILGIENQDTVSYAMPARTMLYDAEQYVGQMRGIEKLHRDKAPGAGAENETPRHDRQRGAALISSGEFLEGFQKDDRLIPVFTVVINWSGKAWTGFRTLHEMFGPVDSSVLAFIPDYRINLISPTEMSEEDRFGRCSHLSGTPVTRTR